MSTGMAGRRLALSILNDNSGRFAKELLGKKLKDIDLESADRGLVTELVYGIVKHSHTLNHIICYYSHHVPSDPKIRNILMLGLYQLLFMERIPPYAAIDTSVKLLKKSRHTKLSGYVNGVLRTVQREAQRQETTQEGSHILPIGNGYEWKFAKPVFVSPRKKLLFYRATVHSYPISIVRRWHQQFGPEKSLALLEAGNQSPSVFLRLRREQFRELYCSWQEAGITYSEYQGLILLEKSGEIKNIPGYKEKQWLVAGYASSQVIKSMEIKPGERVLDLCAAPGGKAMHICDLLENSGEVVACDISSSRLSSLSRIAGDLPIKILAVDGRELTEDYHEYFDKVIVDAPCSNSAVFARRAEARWRFSPENLEKLQKLQLELLLSGARTLKPEGIITYSTCSLEPEENQKVIELFLQKEPGFQCIKQEQILPETPHFDGGTFFSLQRV